MVVHTFLFVYKGEYVADFKYGLRQKVWHENYGYGEISGRITIRGKILLKDTYLVAFPEGTRTVKEKTLKVVTPEEWRARPIKVT